MLFRKHDHHLWVLSLCKFQVAAWWGHGRPGQLANSSWGRPLTNPPDLHPHPFPVLLFPANVKLGTSLALNKQHSCYLPDGQLEFILGGSSSAMLTMSLIFHLPEILQNLWSADTSLFGYGFISSGTCLLFYTFFYPGQK